MRRRDRLTRHEKRSAVGIASTTWAHDGGSHSWRSGIRQSRPTAHRRKDEDVADNLIPYAEGKEPRHWAGGDRPTAATR